MWARRGLPRKMAIILPERVDRNIDVQTMMMIEIFFSGRRLVSSFPPLRSAASPPLFHCSVRCRSFSPRSQSELLCAPCSSLFHCSSRVPRRLMMMRSLAAISSSFTFLSSRAFSTGSHVPFSARSPFLSLHYHLSKFERKKRTDRRKHCKTEELVWQLPTFFCCRYVSRVLVRKRRV